MKENFWEQLPKPFFALAPLYDVTDCAFREMIARRKTPPSLPLEGEGGSDPLSLPLLGGGPPQVMFTEFVSVDGLCHEKSRDKSLGSARDKLIKLHLGYTENQRPIVAQLWGSDPEKFKVAAEIVRELGFDGIDINMGCPDKKVVMMGAGPAVLIGPTAGYLVGMLVAVGIVGLARTASERAWAMLLGTVAIYTLGAGWLGHLIGVDKAITLGVVPFLLGDAVKAALAWALSLKFNRG